MDILVAGFFIKNREKRGFSWISRLWIVAKNVIFRGYLQICEIRRKSVIFLVFLDAGADESGFGRGRCGSWILVHF